MQEVSMAMSLFGNREVPFTRNDLQKITTAVANLDISENVLDVCFKVFDNTNDGALDNKEFFQTLKGLSTFGLSKPRDIGFERFVTCVKNTLKFDQPI